MSKKIGSYEAFNIASRVASKAFEHLITPAQERLDQVAMAAYTQELQDCGITPEIEAKMRARRKQRQDANYDHKCKINYGKADEDECIYELSFDKVRPLTGYIHLQNKKSCKAIEAAHATLTPLEYKCALLRDDIKAQINGKTTAVVRKHWPELTGFVEDVMREGINMNPISPVPFQSLLNKHLLALAAPTTTAEAA